jgi:hypothetical protein
MPTRNHPRLHHAAGGFLCVSELRSHRRHSAERHPYAPVIAFTRSAGDGLTVYNFGGDCIPLASAEEYAHALLALLVDPRVKAAIEARRAA